MSAVRLDRDLGIAHTAPEWQAPSPWLMAAEIRGLFELGLGLATLPLLLNAPRGDGHPVLVLPGFMAGDISTLFLRQFLSWRGYDAYGWDLGTNMGGVTSMRRKLRRILTDLHDRTGRRVSLVGWSLGGTYARDLALTLPKLVRYVITMGSPFAGDLRAINTGRVYQMVSGESIEHAPPGELARLEGDLAVPTSALYSRTDGIVHWRTSMVREAARAENIEVCASHVGLGVNPGVLWALADRLSQPEGSFARFTPRGPYRMLFPG